MRPSIRSFVSALTLCAILMSEMKVHAQEPFDYSVVLPKAKAALPSMPVTSAASLIRMLLDSECDEEVSAYLARLGAEDRDRLLNSLIYEGGHFGSLATINYLVRESSQGKSAQGESPVLRSICRAASRC